MAQRVRTTLMLAGRVTGRAAPRDVPYPRPPITTIFLSKLHVHRPPVGAGDGLSELPVSFERPWTVILRSCHRMPLRPRSPSHGLLSIAYRGYEVSTNAQRVKRSAAEGANSLSRHSRVPDVSDTRDIIVMTAIIRCHNRYWWRTPGKGCQPI